MSQRRVELQRMLEKLLGSRNVYFQPPTGTKLSYPCIVYRLENANDVHADNRLYRRLKRYSLTYITKNPDDPLCDIIDNLQYCSWSGFFISDNLNHYMYSIYY